MTRDEFFALSWEEQHRLINLAEQTKLSSGFSVRMVRPLDFDTFQMLIGTEELMRRAKPGEHSEKARRYAVSLTMLEQVIGYFERYVLHGEIEDNDPRKYLTLAQSVGQEQSHAVPGQDAIDQILHDSSLRQGLQKK